jgi:hypothetical protein
MLENLLEYYRKSVCSKRRRGEKRRKGEGGDEKVRV